MGHHDGDMPVEKMDVNGEGDLIASIGKDDINAFLAYIYALNNDLTICKEKFFSIW